jgi:hypothetical protein
MKQSAGALPPDGVDLQDLPKGAGERHRGT